MSRLTESGSCLSEVGPPRALSHGSWPLLLLGLLVAQAEASRPETVAKLAGVRAAAVAAAAAAAAVGSQISVAIKDALSRHYVRCLSDATSAIVSVRWRLG
jgi:hypothetical protein